MEKPMAHPITLIRGDGIGPEVALATKRCVNATGVDITWNEVDAGADLLKETGELLPDSVIETIRRDKVAIKAPITTPVATGFRSVNVHLRKVLDLYACVRPCKANVLEWLTKASIAKVSSVEKMFNQFIFFTFS